MSEEVLEMELSRSGTPQAAPRPRAFSIKTIPLTLWNELIWPSRKTWAALAAVWVGLAVLYLTTQDTQRTEVAPTVIDGRTMALWGEQQKMLMQMVNPRTEMAAKPAAPAGPPPGVGKSAEWKPTYTEALA